MKKLIYFSFLIIFFDACSVKNNNIVGTYYYYSKINKWKKITAFEVNINSDSTFCFHNKILNMIPNVSLVKGKWTVNKKYIFLNSFDQPPKDSLIVIESEDTDRDSTTLFVNLLEEEEPLFFSIIIINNDTLNKYRTDFNGELTVKKQEIKSIKISNLSTGNYTYKTKQTTSNSYKIWVYPAGLYRNKLFFTNEKWKIKKNKLKDKYNRVYYKKIKMN